MWDQFCTYTYMTPPTASLRYCREKEQSWFDPNEQKPHFNKKKKNTQ